MNLKYHAVLGLCLEIIIPESKGLCFIASIMPDLILIKNEAKLIYYKKTFNENEVGLWTYRFYHLIHSLNFSLILLLINKYLFYGHLLHIISDWFTHVGRFASMPFYPISKKRIKFGRNILK